VNGSKFTALTQGKRYVRTDNTTIMSAVSIRRQKKTFGLQANPNVLIIETGHTEY
jgi:hypothetical protein